MNHFCRPTIVLSWMAVSVLLGCGGSDGNSADDNSCEGIDCSGHGDCVVSGNDTALCICDEGYHNEDAYL